MKLRPVIRQKSPFSYSFAGFSCPVLIARVFEKVTFTYRIFVSSFVLFCDIHPGQLVDSTESQSNSL